MGWRSGSRSSPAPPTRHSSWRAALAALGSEAPAALRELRDAAFAKLEGEPLALLRSWDERVAAVRSPQYSYDVRGAAVAGENYRETLSGLSCRRSPPRGSRAGATACAS